MKIPFISLPPKPEPIVGLCFTGILYGAEALYVGPDSYWQMQILPEGFWTAK